jgi:hypothetical protein
MELIIILVMKKMIFILLKLTLALNFKLYKIKKEEKVNNIKSNLKITLLLLKKNKNIEKLKMTYLMESILLIESLMLEKINSKLKLIKIILDSAKMKIVITLVNNKKKK